MKIKKIAQSIGVLGKILNTKSTSQENTYSCDYINNNVLFPLEYSRGVGLIDIIGAKPTSNTSTSYTFDDNGYLYLFATRGSVSGFTIYINIDGINRFYFPAYDAYATVNIIIPVKKGQVLKIMTDSSEETWTIRELSFMK